MSWSFFGYHTRKVIFFRSDIHCAIVINEGKNLGSKGSIVKTPIEATSYKWTIPIQSTKKIPGKSRLLEPPRSQSPVSRKKPRLLFGWRLDNFHYYSFKILPRFWLAKSTRIIQLNQLLMTKFGRILRFMNRWRQKCLNYGWIRKRAIWSESCDLIGYPIGQDWPSCSLGISRVCPARKSSLFVDIANPLLTNREVKMAGYWPQFLDLFRLCQ